MRATSFPTRVSAMCATLAVVATTMLAGVSLPAPALAQGDAGLGVENVLGEYTVSPGQVVEHAMRISLGATAPAPLEVKIEPRGLGQGPDGSTVALTDAEDKSPQSARAYFQKLDRGELHLEPGDSVSVKATFAIPNDAEPGTRYADIYIHSQPTGSGRVGVVLAANVPILLTIPGAPMVETGTITSLDVPTPLSGRPIKLTATAVNTGNHHFKADAVFTLLDPAGQVVTRQVVPMSGSSLLPGFPRLYQASMSMLDRAAVGLPAGTYTAEAALRHSDGRTLEMKRTPVQINAPYQPFPDIDPASLFVRQFENEEPGHIDARRETDVDLDFRDTGKVTGTLVIGRFRRDPQGLSIAAPIPDGGLDLGHPAQKYVGIGVQGFTRGQVDTSLYYRDTEISGVNVNSLFMALRGPDRWTKVDGQSVFPGAQNVRATLPVSVFNDNPAFALAGDPLKVEADAAPSIPTWVILGIAGLVGLVIGPSLVLYLTRRKRSA
jgi:hypothetical protein